MFKKMYFDIFFKFYFYIYYINKMEISQIIAVILVIIAIIIIGVLIYLKFTASGTALFNKYVSSTGWMGYIYTILGIEILKKSSFCGSEGCGTGGSF